MKETLKKVIELIEGQVKSFGEYSPVRMAGEQLKEIARADEHDAELLAEDLQKKGMGVADAEKQIRARADEIHRKEKGNAVAVPPWEAEDILRKFYGLRERSWGPGKERTAHGDGGTDCHGLRPRNDSDKGKIFDLADFL